MGTSYGKIGIFDLSFRNKDKFEMLYVGDCQKTEEKSFFTSHEQFKCWLQKSTTEQSLCLAILPMFESSNEKRQNVIKKFLLSTNPLVILVKYLNQNLIML